MFKNLFKYRHNSNLSFNRVK